MQAFSMLNRLSHCFSLRLSFQTPLISDCLLLLFMPQEDISFLHASLYQGYLAMLKFGFSNCYAENKSEYDSVDSVDFMVMYMYYMFWIMMHGFVLLNNFLNVYKLCIGMVKELGSPHSNLIKSHQRYHLNYTFLKELEFHNTRGYHVIINSDRNNR